MSLIRARSRKQKKNAGAVGHREDNNGYLIEPLPPSHVEVPTKIGTHDRLTGRDRGQTPLTDNQQRVLAALTSATQRTPDIAERSGLNSNQATSSLYALASKGIIDGPLPGWRLAANDDAEAA